MKKKPRFFCDHCGQEVSSDVKSCPRCGRYFASVRCPACDYSGPDEMFGGGCPMCGYSAPPVSRAPAAKAKASRSKKHYSAPPSSAGTYVIPIIIILACAALFSYLITR